ncbi:MAG: hypothetical protein ACOC2U_01155 [bacterium]
MSTTTATSSVIIEDLSQESVDKFISITDGEVILITLFFSFYITFLTFGIIFFIWGGKINRSGSEKYYVNSNEGKKTYYD